MSTFGKRKGGGRRSTQRESAPLIAVLTTLMRAHGAVLLDLSANGARLRGNDLPRLGDELLMSVESLKAFGTVVWSDGPECGIVFAETLHPAVIQSVRERSGHSLGFPADSIGVVANDAELGAVTVPKPSQ